MNGSYGFSNIGSNDLTIENVLSSVSELILWRHYIGCDFVLGRTFSAPHRRDSDPSFCIYENTRRGRHRINGKDFSTGWFGDIIDYLQLLFRTDLYSALVKINIDFDLGLEYLPSLYKLNNCTVITPKVERKELEKFARVLKIKPRVLKIKPRMYTSEDLLYWASYGITKDILKQYKVYPIQELWSDPESEYMRWPIYKYDPANPGYAYHFEVTDHLKCYFPFSKDRRFDGNINNFTDIQGYYQCRIKEDYKGKLLVLTKSMKDCMTLRTYGIDAMAIHGEAHRFHPDFMRHIKKYYPVIVSLYDRDKVGITSAKELWKRHSIVPYFIPKKYKCKDVSDMYKMHGRELTQQFLNIIKLKQQEQCVE